MSVCFNLFLFRVLPRLCFILLVLSSLDILHLGKNNLQIYPDKVQVPLVETLYTNNHVTVRVSSPSSLDFSRHGRTTSPPSLPTSRNYSDWNNCTDMSVEQIWKIGCQPL